MSSPTLYAPPSVGLCSWEVECACVREYDEESFSGGRKDEGVYPLSLRGGYEGGEVLGEAWKAVPLNAAMSCLGRDHANCRYSVAVRDRGAKREWNCMQLPHQFWCGDILGGCHVKDSI